MRSNVRGNPARSGMPPLGQNEMKPSGGMPVRVRLTKVLGRSAMLLTRRYDLEQLVDDVVQTPGGRYGYSISEHWRVGSYS